MNLIPIAASPASNRKTRLHLTPERDPRPRRTFLLYAKVPFARVEPLEAGYRVELHDLRFPDGDTEPANVFVRVDFNSTLQMTHEGFFFASNPNP